MIRIQPRQIRHYCLPWLAGFLLSAGALADEKPDFEEQSEKTLPSYTRDIDDRPFESIKYGKGFKVKGWRFSDGVYFGGVKVDGKYGPGLVFDNGAYVWGFNHERIQFRLRF
jgi:hypothetical protein